MPFVKAPHAHRHQPESRALALLLGVYVLLCLLIAGLNYGYAPKAGPEARAFIAWLWHFYENEFKFALIVLAAILSWRLVSRRRTARHYRRNLIGLTLAAFGLHILGPWLSGNPDLYFFSMPFPWSSVPLQTLVADSPFMAGRPGFWGMGGAFLAFGFWLALGLVVALGTLVQGRRWQCSTLCLFNGFASEIFTTVFPLFGAHRPIGRGLRRLFKAMRWLLLGVALLFSAYWLARAAGLRPLPAGLAPGFEGLEVVKYLSVELLLAMFFWLALTGRGYCQYCPLGFTLSGLSRLAGQRIAADGGACIACAACNRSCPMGIDLMSRARQGQPSVDSRCVGCAHCVDRCPQGVLRYTTHARELLRRRRRA